MFESVGWDRRLGGSVTGGSIRFTTPNFETRNWGWRFVMVIFFWIALHGSRWVAKIGKGSSRLVGFQGSFKNVIQWKSIMLGGELDWSLSGGFR